jgi:hypothetical protein
MWVCVYVAGPLPESWSSVAGMANLAIFRCAYCNLDKVALLSSPGLGNDLNSPWIFSLKQLDLSGNNFPTYEDEAGTMLDGLGNLHIHTLQVAAAFSFVRMAIMA